VGGAVPKGEDQHNNINKNQHGQPYLDDKESSTKYQTLPFGSNNFRFNNNKKDHRFSEAPASTSDYQKSAYLATDHQGNYASANDNNNLQVQIL
jgi:hypothetical protein